MMRHIIARDRKLDLVDAIEGHGGSTSRIFISGHSAGGYLTSMIGLDKRWLAAHNIDANQIAGLIPLSGHTITPFTVRKERGSKNQAYYRRLSAVIPRAR